MKPKELLLIFCAEWRRAYNASYPVAWAKHSAMTKRLLDTYGPEQAEALVRAYFRLREPFIESKGRPLELLWSAVPRLLVLLEQEKAAVPVISDDAERLRKAREAL